MRIKFSLNVNLYNLTLTKDLYYGDGSWTSRASPPWRCGSPSRGRRPGQDQSSCSSQRSAGEAESVFKVKVKIIIMTECKKVKVKISVWLQKECKITCELSSAWLNPPPGAPFSSPSSKMKLFFKAKNDLKILKLLINISTYIGKTNILLLQAKHTIWLLKTRNLITYGRNKKFSPMGETQKYSPKDKTQKCSVKVKTQKCSVEVKTQKCSPKAKTQKCSVKVKTQK